MRFAEGAVVIDEQLVRRGNYGTGTAKDCPATKFYRRELDTFYETDGEPQINILPWIHRIFRKRRTWRRVMAKHRLRQTLVNRFPAALNHYLGLYHTHGDNYGDQLAIIPKGDHPADQQARLHVKTEWLNILMRDCVLPLVHSYREILYVATATELKLALDEALDLEPLGETEIIELITMVTMASRVAKGDELPYTTAYTPEEFCRAVGTASACDLGDHHSDFIGAQDFIIHYLRLYDEREEVLAYLTLEHCSGRDELQLPNNEDGFFLDADDIDETVGRVWTTSARTMFDADWEAIDLPSIKMEVVQGFPVREYLESKLNERQMEGVYPLASERRETLEEHIRYERIDGNAVALLSFGPENDEPASAYSTITDLFMNNPLFEWTPAGTVLRLAPKSRGTVGDYIVSSDGYFRWIGPQQNTVDWHRLLGSFMPSYEPVEVVLGTWLPDVNQMNIKWKEE